MQNRSPLFAVSFLAFSLLLGCWQKPIPPEHLVGTWQGEAKFSESVPEAVEKLRPQVVFNADNTFAVKDFVATYPAEGKWEYRLYDGEGHWRLPGRKDSQDRLKLAFGKINGQTPPLGTWQRLFTKGRKDRLVLIQSWDDSENYEGIVFRKLPTSAETSKLR